VKALRQHEEREKEGVLMPFKRSPMREGPRWGRAFTPEEDGDFGLTGLRSSAPKVKGRTGRKAQPRLNTPTECTVGKGDAPESGEVISPALAPGALGRWLPLVRALLWREGSLVGQGHVVPRALSHHRCAPSMEQAQRWAHLHGAYHAPDMVEEHRPYQLTLGYQLRVLDILEFQRQERCMERRWRRKWVRWWTQRQLHQAVRSWCKFISITRANAAVPALVCRVNCRYGSWCYRTSAQHRSEYAHPGDPDWNSWTSDWNSWNGWNSRTFDAPDSHQDAVAAAELGLDVGTYRMLKQLEQRDIVPEDYELLGRLDESIKPATLRPEQLRRFPTETYCTESSSQEAKETCSADFGVDFWRLPLLQTEEEIENDARENNGEVKPGFLHGADYWRLPLPLLDNVSVVSTNDESTDEQSTGSDSDMCAVCYVDFEIGDAVRRLQPCGHIFHKGCIDRWLLESSTRCPVDKREVF